MFQDYDLNDLRNKVGYIPQKLCYFLGCQGQSRLWTESETPLSEQAMWQALELAQSKNFIEDKEAGLASEVAQGGTNFSGGQDSVWPLRALARRPEILIFDDSFSALDYKTDRVLRQELAEKTKSMTKLIVAQRISTIMDADLILVLDQGKVVGQGTHKELLANNEVYQEIAYSQLSEGGIGTWKIRKCLWKQSKPYLAGLQFALLCSLSSNNRIQYHYCIWSTRIKEMTYYCQWSGNKCGCRGGRPAIGSFWSSSM